MTSSIRTALFTCAVSAALLLTATYPAQAQKNDPLLAAIKARQGYMQMVKFNAGPLFGMAKGEIDYDAETAAMLANNLQILNELNNGHVWPADSDNLAYADETRALPEIWDADSRVGEANQAYADAVDALADVAGDGLDALRSTIGDVGNGCKGCHDDYRAEQ